MPPTNALTLSLKDGDRGTRQTVELIRQLVAQGVTDPEIRRAASAMLQGVPAYQDVAAARAIFNAILPNSAWHVRFTPDMAATWDPRRGWVGKETLQTARHILETRAGDCDDINAILLPSLLGSVGFRTRAVTVKSDPEAPEEFSHIYVEVEAPQGSGQWIALDAARPDVEFGRAPEVYWDRERFDLTGGDSRLGGLNGFRRLRLMPRFGLGALGQDDTSILANILQAAPSIEQGAASIVKAANMPTYSVFPYGSGVGINPATGFPIAASGGLSLTGGASSGVWLLVGLGLILVFAIKR